MRKFLILFLIPFFGLAQFNPVAFYNYGSIKGVNYGSTALLLSLRKLNPSYSGNCIKVRRSSDNTTQDIGFSSGVLDTSALLSFVGAGNGFVDTWYDQSPNGRNATQTTQASQPQIVSSGSVLVSNSKPTIKFSTGVFMDLPNNYSVTTLSIYHVTEILTGCAQYFTVISHALPSGTGFGLVHTNTTAFHPAILTTTNGTASASAWGYNLYNATPPQALNVYNWFYDGTGLSTSSLKEYINNANLTITGGLESGWGTFTGSGLNKGYSGVRGTINISEVFYWQSNQQIFRATVTNDIKTFYGI